MTKRGVIVLFIAVAVAAGVLGWLSAEALAAKIKRDRLADGLGEVQRAVEVYAIDHAGAYPASLDELLAAGTLAAMPENPYTKQPMPVLAAKDDPVPGGVVYVAWGPLIADNEGVARQENFQYVIAAFGRTRRSEAQPPELEEAGCVATAALDWSQVELYKTTPPFPEKPHPEVAPEPLPAPALDSE